MLRIDWMVLGMVAVRCIADALNFLGHIARRGGCTLLLDV